MKRLIAAGLAAAAVLLSGCGNTGYGTTTGKPDLATFSGNPGTPSCINPTRPPNTALYCPAAGILPYPFDAYFAGSTDGTLNIQPPNAVWPNQAGLNQIDGFSTNASIRERFNGPIDAASLATAGAVVVIHINTNNAGPQAKAPVKPTAIGGTGAFAPLMGCVVGGNCAGADYSVGVAIDDPATLEITPLHPLAASTCLPNPPVTCGAAANGGNGEGYLVLLTKAITVGGAAAAPDVDYASFQAALASGGPTCPSITDPTLNALCQLTGAHLGLAQLYAGVAPGFNPADVVASFSFSTGSTVDTLALLGSPNITMAQTFKANPTGLSTKQVNQGLAGHADVYVGVLTIPYYLSKKAPLTGSWQAPPFAKDPTSTLVTRFNPVPVPTEMLQIPALITVPNANSAYHAVFNGPIPPPNGWPVVIYQHGVVVNREYMLPVADSFADAGFVVVAIDLPLHGVTNKNDPLYATDTHPAYTGLIPPGTGSIERTFDLDLNTNQGYTVIPDSPPDGVIDPTGSHFLNLESPVTARDNFREAAADLITLERSLPNLAQSPVPIPVDMTRLHYVGHSGGGIAGTMFMAVTPPTVIPAASLVNTGGNWALLAQTSPSFSPDVLAALAAKGIVKGTTLFAQFWRDVQNIVDAGDPINYIALTTAQHPIHMMTVVGTTPPPAACTPSPPVPGCPDQTVPPPATQALITASAYGPAGAAGALTRIARSQGPVYMPPGGMIRGYVNFLDGYHGSLIDPSENPAVTVEMQREAVSFTGVAIPPAIPSANPPGSTLLILDPTGVVQN